MFSTTHDRYFKSVTRNMQPLPLHLLKLFFYSYYNVVNFFVSIQNLWTNIINNKNSDVSNEIETGS